MFIEAKWLVRISIVLTRIRRAYRLRVEHQELVLSESTLAAHQSQGEDKI